LADGHHNDPYPLSGRQRRSRAAELHTEEGTITFEITEEVAEGMIKAMHQFRMALKSVVKPAA
jgi:hypothetical protein